MTRGVLLLALLVGLAPGRAAAAAIDLSRLAVVGDSLAVGVGSGDPSEPVRRTSYASRLAAQAGSRLACAAVSGARVEDALAQAAAVASSTPTTVLVWIGSNDALFAALSADPSRLTPPDRFERAFRDVVRRVSGTGATLVVATVPDVTRTPRAAGLPAEVAATIRDRVAVFNRAIADTARAAGALLVDVHGLFETVHRE
ncbi:MAG TPA: GDSL-type esterase/lipase family protein, partial [Thermodesulfobacteriota bacterium]